MHIYTDGTVMLNHGGNCFYHHCATLKVVPPGQGPDAGATGGDAGTGPSASHGGCNSAGGGGLGIAFASIMVVVARRRRR